MLARQSERGRRSWDDHKEEQAGCEDDPEPGLTEGAWRREALSLIVLALPPLPPLTRSSSCSAKRRSLRSCFSPAWWACGSLLAMQAGDRFARYSPTTGPRGGSEVQPTRSGPWRSRPASVSYPQYDQTGYRRHHLVENLFEGLKRLRGFATRYCKLAPRFRAIMCLAGWFLATKRAT